jgi:TMEM175 potassium channel family protein
MPRRNGRSFPAADTLSRMKLPYNRIAGKNVDRLAGLSDGVFAIAMTLLVLDLRVPASDMVHSEHDLWRTLLGLLPRLTVYGMSVLTLGIFWIGQQTQLNHLSRSDRNLSWIHIAFLAGISLMPFSTALLAEFIRYRVALIVYWANLLLVGIVIYASWQYAVAGKLVKEDLPVEIRCAIERRILVAQGLYAFGALLCVFGTYWSIGFIVFWQLNFAIAPRVRWLSWI